MARKKSNLGKIVLSLAGLLIVGGAAATVTAGFLTDWSFNQTDVFKDVVIESQEIAYDGTAHSLAIKLPEGATYKLTITNSNGELVSEAKDIGVYTFNYDVTIDNTTKTFTATLTIKDESELETKVEAKGLHLKVSSVNELANGDIVKTITYTVQPTDADPTIKVDSILKGGQDASSIVDVEINTAAKEITLTCHEAFDQQILVKVVHADNSDINATITCDYRKKLLSKAFNVSLGDYGNLSGTKISLDAYKIYNEFSGSGKFTLNPTSAIVQNFSYSIGTLEYEKSSVSATTTKSLGNNYSTSSSLTSLYMSNGSYIGLAYGNTISFNVNSSFKNVVNGVNGLASGSYQIGTISYVDETGGTNNFTVELTASGSFLSSMSVSGNVIF